MKKIDYKAFTKHVIAFLETRYNWGINIKHTVKCRKCQTLIFNVIIKDRYCPMCGKMLERNNEAKLQFEQLQTAFEVFLPRTNNNTDKTELAKFVLQSLYNAGWDVYSNYNPAKCYACDYIMGNGEKHCRRCGRKVPDRYIKAPFDSCTEMVAAIEYALNQQTTT